MAISSVKNADKMSIRAAMVKRRALISVNKARDVLGKKPVKRFRKCDTGENYSGSIQKALGFETDIVSVMGLPEDKARELAKEWRTRVDEYDKDTVYFPKAIELFIDGVICEDYPELEYGRV